MRRARAASAKIIAVTGSAGKTSTKEALRHALSAGRQGACLRQVVQQPLGRAADAGAHAGRLRLCDLRDRHEPCGRDPAAGRSWCRPHVAIVTLIAAAHLGHFNDLDEIATAKAEIFEGVEPGGAALLNRDDPALGAARQAGQGRGRRAQSSASASMPRPTYRLTECRAASGSFADLGADRRQGSRRRASARPAGTSCRTRWRCSALPHLVGADVEKVALSLASLSAETGRGKRHVLESSGRRDHADRRKLQRQSRLDAGGDRRCSTRRRSRARGGRIAVLGDMLELGSHSAKLHAGACRPDHRARGRTSSCSPGRR